jgi:uncharacterized membrane-anchored protein
MDKRIKYVVAAVVAGAGMLAAYYYPTETFTAFVSWLSPSIPFILILILGRVLLWIEKPNVKVTPGN